ncbi:MAG: EthD domain-containing protein [Candidatus Dormibacteraeota bacterium]|nr:EthD domain-containing protein [Candidatus Dormibacteraeota bacterium]
MIKLVYCITRKPGLSPEEFSHYWEHVHGPIGRRIPGLRRLVQSHSVAPLGGPTAGFDGVAELWFDSLVAVEAARQSPEWRVSTEDETNFVDPTRSASFLTVEREIPESAT